MRILSKIARQIRFAFAEKLDGYENPELVDVVFRKTKAFRPTEPWTEIDGARTVLDFGGGCGIHYKMMQSPSVRWAVVETRAMAERASEIATDKLRFFSNISDAAAWLGNIDVMHSSGSLQYAREPAATLRELCSLNAKVMLWKRVALSDKTETEIQSSLLIHNGPGEVKGVKNKSVSYPLTRIPVSLFMSCHARYRVETHREYILEDRRADDFHFVLSQSG
jgi:hypothetical protein